MVKKQTEFHDGDKLTWYSMKQGDPPKVATYSIVLEDRCVKFHTAKKTYTGAWAHRKYLEWRRYVEQEEYNASDL